MLLLVYRSIVTTLVSLFLDGIELLCGAGIAATAGNYNIFGLTTFASNIVTMLAIAAATDYGIFIFGRYREARGAGQDRENAYYTRLSVGVARDPGFGPDDCRGDVCADLCTAAVLHYDGSPVAIGLLVLVAAAITLAPAVLSVAVRFGLFEAKRRLGTRAGARSAPPWSAGPPHHGRQLDRGRSAWSPCPTYDRSTTIRSSRPPACRGQSRIRRCRPAFHPGPDESGLPDGRSRPRHAQSGRHAGSGQGRQKRLQHRGYRHGPGHHPAAGNADPAQLDTVRDQHAELEHHAAPIFSTTTPRKSRAAPTI